MAGSCAVTHRPEPPRVAPGSGVLTSSPFWLWEEPSDPQVFGPLFLASKPILSIPMAHERGQNSGRAPLTSPSAHVRLGRRSCSA